jgi:hypothetical protein
MPQRSVSPLSGTAAPPRRSIVAVVVPAFGVATLCMQHQWDAATVILMGDHSWRTALLWSHDPGWTVEERRASHQGSFDDRPFYAVKLPHQATPEGSPSPSTPLVRSRSSTRFYSISSPPPTNSRCGPKAAGRGLACFRFAPGQSHPAIV